MNREIVSINASNLVQANQAIEPLEIRKKLLYCHFCMNEIKPVCVNHRTFVQKLELAYKTQLVYMRNPE